MTKGYVTEQGTPEAEDNGTSEKISAMISAAGRYLSAGLAGAIVGSFITVAAIMLVMPSMMIQTRTVNMSVEEAEAALKDAMAEEGWVSPGTLNLNKSMAKHGETLEPQVRVVQMCKAKYAKRVLTSDRYVSAMMPCSVAIWEDDEGQTHISKINTGLMGKLFGGNIAKVMGGSVAREEESMLARLTED